MVEMMKYARIKPRVVIYRALRNATQTLIAFQATVAHFAIFENSFFSITCRMLRILIQHVKKICSSEPKLFLIITYSIRISNILEVQ